MLFQTPNSPQRIRPKKKKQKKSARADYDYNSLRTAHREAVEQHSPVVPRPG